MNSARLQRLLTIADKALALKPEERAEYLNEVCGKDTVLKGEVEKLLESAGESESFWEGWKQWNDKQIAALFQQMDKEDPTDLTNQQLGQYHLLERLGAGGMGVVYRARDTRLERDVAIKILTQGMPGSLTSRVLREARAASSLNHPNIVTIYEVGKHGDTDFIVMEYVAGEPLDETINRGPPEIKEALNLCTRIADGLAAAHTKGLLHCDIKPANVMVTPGGQAKILDFGVARHAHTADGRDLAETVSTVTGQTIIPKGTIAGTLGYLAPELLEGSPANTRSDVFALGVTLYQWISGKRPFGGDSDVAVIAATLRNEPPALTRARPDVPSELARIVERCLAGRPGDRYASAEEVARELAELGASIVTLASAGPRMYRSAARWHRDVVYAGAVLLAAVAGTGLYILLNSSPAPAASAETDMTSPRFLAVLPFANTSPDPGNEYFADGVTDDVLAHLAQVPDFSVISRTTMMGYKGSGKSIPEIAEELGVGYVLEGSVRRAGDRVRITARLVDSQTDRALWAEAYDRAIEDVFAVQTEIARSIAGALEIGLSGEVATRIGQRYTEDTEAYDLFLLGRENLYRYDPESNNRAIDLFKQALALDPEFTLARAWLSRAHMLNTLNYGWERSWAETALAEARRSVAEQADLSDAHVALGSALTAVGQFGTAAAAFERGLELNPSDWIATNNAATNNEGLNRWDEAIRLARMTLELNPVRSHAMYSNLAYHYAVLGMYDHAQAAVERALSIVPDDPDALFPQYYLDLCRGRREAVLQGAQRLADLSAGNAMAGFYATELFLWTGEIERAKATAEIVYSQAPRFSVLRPYLAGVVYAYTLKRTGKTDQAHTILREMERYVHEQIEEGADAPQFRHALAAIYALRGERDEAFYWLDEAIRLGWNNSTALPVPDPLLDVLHDDPRYRTALDRMERSLAPMRERVEQEGW